MTVKCCPEDGLYSLCLLLNLLSNSVLSKDVSSYCGHVLRLSRLLSTVLGHCSGLPPHYILASAHATCFLLRDC